MAAKKIHQSTITGQRGVALIQQIVLEMGFIWHQTNIDAGIDGYIEIRDPATGDVTNNIIQVQSKATKGSFAAENANSFQWTPEERDLEYWLRGNAPVIVIVSRPEADEAYWVSIKDYYRDPARRKARTVHFDKRRDRFDESAATALARLAAAENEGIYFSPPPKNEILFSNLLRVQSFGEHLYLAETGFRSLNGLWSELKRLDRDTRGEWLLKSGSILSFHDLEIYPWNQICDVGTVERFDSTEWAYSDDPDKKRDFVQLLNRCLREKTRLLGLWFDADSKCYYVVASKKLHPKHFRYQSFSNETSREIFGPRYKRNSQGVAYYRHSAFEGQFKFHANEWYLTITPTYYFTNDGYHVDLFCEQRLKRIKQFEKHLAVVGQVVMWAEFLCPPCDMFRPRYSLLEFDKLQTFNAGFGIDDQAWKRSREQAEGLKEWFESNEC